jgi:hypothetical protein
VRVFQSSFGGFEVFLLYQELVFQSLCRIFLDDEVQCLSCLEKKKWQSRRCEREERRKWKNQKKKQRGERGHPLV